jgi:hypothetical protein
MGTLAETGAEPPVPGAPDALGAEEVGGAPVDAGGVDGPDASPVFVAVD